MVGLKRFIIILLFYVPRLPVPATAFLLNETRFRAERRNYCLFCWFNELFIQRKVIIKNSSDVIWLQKILFEFYWLKKRLSKGEMEKDAVDEEVDDACNDGEDENEWNVLRIL